MDNSVQILKLFQEYARLMREFFYNELHLAGVTVSRKIESHEQKFHGSNLKEGPPNENIVVSGMSRMHHLIVSKMHEIDKKLAELIKANDTALKLPLVDNKITEPEQFLFELVPFATLPQ